MARPKEPYSYKRRNDTKTYQFNLNPECGLPEKVCRNWKRKSFAKLPDELSQYRNPKRGADAKIAIQALIEYLKIKVAEGQYKKISSGDSTVGLWIEKFTILEKSPRTGINSAKNRPYSIATINKYRSYWELHIKGDPITKLKMSELEESDILEFSNRLSVKKKDDGGMLGGTRTFAGIIIFFRMAFKNYQNEFPRWINPFVRLPPPKYSEGNRGALTEDEVVKLFMPGVLKTVMELAVCTVMFFSGLRRAEIAALRQEDLDWHTPRINVRRAWQDFDHKTRILGPTKGKKARDAPFDPILQEAIKKTWLEHGEHEWVFSTNGRHLHPKWIDYRFKKWLKDAGIDVNGRDIVPHSSRHSLASLLE